MTAGRSTPAESVRIALALLCLGLLLVHPLDATGARAGTQVARSEQAAAPALPSVDDVLEKYRRAIGGPAAIKKHRSRRILGRFELTAQAIGGPLEIVSAAPDRLLLRMELGGLGRVERGFDGKSGWSIDPGIGPRLLEGRELEELRHSADFYSELKDVSQFASATLVERTVFENKDCYVVKLVRPYGVEVTEYYDTGTGLLAGSRMNSTSAMGTIPTTVVVDEYKTFDGVLLPTKARQRAMGVEWVLVTTSVEHDKVPADAFVVPPEIVALRSKQ
jgi:hypothetical protein